MAQVQPLISNNIMNYIKISIILATGENPDATDIISANLSDQGFESFVETENGLEAFVPENCYNKTEIDSLLESLNQTMPFSWSHELIQEKNWNEEWEKNYEPVLVAGRCHIRAPFHPRMMDVDFEIEIEPKMSFGTAHHETTRMMIELMLEHDFHNQKVLDMGCGTGVLAILASKMGASEVLAIDNDEWAFNNAIENVVKNDAKNVKVLLGDDRLLDNELFDIVIANINRNILLQQFDAYAKSLKKSGCIFLSGFYEADIPHLLQKASSWKFDLIKKIRINSWVAIIVG